MVTTAIGVGSNLGDSVAIIRKGVDLLSANGFRRAKLSFFYETRPVDCVAGTPNFINTVVIGQWEGTARALLDVCADIETTLGRPREHASDQARTLDLDLLLFGEMVCYEGGLKIPHPLLRKRLFVLIPLNDIAAHWRIPPDNLTVAEALAALKKKVKTLDGIRRLE